MASAFITISRGMCVLGCRPHAERRCKSSYIEDTGGVEGKSRLVRGFEGRFVWLGVSEV